MKYFLFISRNISYDSIQLLPLRTTKTGYSYGTKILVKNSAIQKPSLHEWLNHRVLPYLTNNSVFFFTYTHIQF